MFKHSISSFLLLAACVAINAASHSSSGEASGHKAALAAIQPRLLLWNRRSENKPQQPIVIVQPNSDESDRHHHRRPYYPDYYPYPYPPTPQRPPFQVPGLNDYFGGGGPSIIIINPNNAQNLTAPAAPAAATTGGRSGGLRRNAVPIIDLLQGLNAQEDDTEVINAAENESEAAAAAAAMAAAQAPLAQYGAEERDEDLAEDELALLERQAARGLSTKHLLSLLLQDKRRRHFQEAAAGIYLRNYNQNRK
ncbi:uncharacterized protein [Drosophila virilis]|uniref:Uncharacterized protein n=1 Tax=Drosophila virilis TaxID=7244 RepID=B4LR35_DROVI|nr:uncharacterized protein LOC6628287 [Drosophila virilis]EDW63499.1 uncharacterized protein Dvir_GJ15290 [Drosophila virilis]